MSEDRKTVASLLRLRSTYEDEGAADPDPRWKDALLADLDLEASLPRAERPTAADATEAPLRLRHLGMLAPLGAALFLAGYWFGAEGMTTADLAQVHPAWWVGIALSIAAGSLLRFGRPLWRR
ncbi:MAG: hypothetical protein GY838_14085 [bacterium]|nr:hypothetical protein [bacterium]